MKFNIAYNRLIYSGIFFLSLVVFFIIIWDKPINCTADTAVHLNDDIMKVIYTVRMDKGKGAISMVGTLIQNGRIVGKISRSTKFDYTNRGVSYHLTSTSSLKSNIDTVPNDTLSLYTPDFFIKPRNFRNFDILPTKDGGWLFIMHSIPFFQCNNSL